MSSISAGVKAAGLVDEVAEGMLQFQGFGCEGAGGKRLPVYSSRHRCNAQINCRFRGVSPQLPLNETSE